MFNIIKNEILKDREVPEFEKTSPRVKKAIFGILSIIILVSNLVAFMFVTFTGTITIFFIFLGISIIFFIYCIINRSKVGDVALFFSSIVPIVTLALFFYDPIHFF